MIHFKQKGHRETSLLHWASIVCGVVWLPRKPEGRGVWLGRMSRARHLQGVRQDLISELGEAKGNRWTTQDVLGIHIVNSNLQWEVDPHHADS